MRLLSWNVRSLRDDRDALLAVLGRAAPDLLAVQEAPRFLGWRRAAARLAADAGLRVVTGGRPAAAMLLLAGPRIEVLATRDLLLSKAPRLHQRGLAAAVVRADGGPPFGIVSMHLDVVAAERARHVPEVLAHVAALGVPTVLAGDVNETAADPAWRAIAALLPELSAGLPAGVGTEVGGRRIDAVFGAPGLAARSAEVLTGPDVDVASDHRPVLVVLEPPA